MMFFDYPDSYRELKRKAVKNFPSVSEFYNLLLAEANVNLNHDAIVAHNQWTMEWDWHESGRPYYNVYPGIIPYLAKLKEQNVPASCVNLPLKTLVFRLPDCDFFKMEFQGKKYQLRSILVGSYNETKSFLKLDDKTMSIGEDVSFPTLTLWMDWGEKDTSFLGDNYPVLLFRKLLMKPNSTLEEAMSALGMDSSIGEGVQIPPIMVENAVRMVCSICLLSQDKEDGLIIPDVLNEDKSKWMSDPEKYISKAKRRGKFGWTVGETFSVAPHWRGPSPLALYWTGEGHKIPRYRYRRGTIVHKKQIKDLPTGFGDVE